MDLKPNYPRLENLEKRTFGKLTVIKFAEMRTSGNQWKPHWRCRCDCGNETVVWSGNLKSGQVKSCGCTRKLPKYHDLIGQEFGNLTVVRFGDRKKNAVSWICRCTCGREVNVLATNLRNGGVRSCGIHQKREKRVVRTKSVHISQAQYKLLIEKQHGRCAACGKKPVECTPLFVDHHHSSMVIRGLLCLSCNSVIGHCQEDVQILELIMNYLNSFSLFTKLEEFA